MNAKELYDYITKQIPPEKALMNLLEGHLIEYEKLKFSAEGEEIHPIMLISMAAMDMGWDIIIRDDQEEVQGLIVGTEDYINDALGKNDDFLDKNEN